MLLLIFRKDIEKKEQIVSSDLLKKIFFQNYIGVSPYRDYISKKITLFILLISINLMDQKQVNMKQ